MTDTLLAPIAAESIPTKAAISTTKPLPARTQTRTATAKLHALTSLRFFAAAMIVLLHSQGYFGSIAALSRFTLTQGVCFFFVLSGFILTYAYPHLDWQGMQRFLVARLARIVPMHVAAFLLYVLLLPGWYRDAVSRNTPGTAALTLSLLQAWVPVYRVQTAFNGVSWSLSVELFFYICFPLLLWRWRRTWAAKLLLTLLVACGAILVANRWLGYLPRGAEVRDVVYFHPLARVWEFTLGVGAAHLWQYLHPRLRCGRRLGTALEAIVLGATFLVMLESGAWAHHAGRWALIGPGGEAWLASSGFVCLPFAALILLMAFEWGWVARFLSCRPLVLLGEISFSLYLLHLLICHVYVNHPRAFVNVPPLLLFLGFWVVAILAAYVAWFAIEVPCRRAIVGLWDRFVARGGQRTVVTARGVSRAQPRRFRATAIKWRYAAASSALLLILIGLQFASRPALPAPTALEGTPPVQGRALISIDSIGEQSALHGAPVVLTRDAYPSDAVPIIGWSVDPAHHGLVRGVLVSVDGNAGTWAEYGSGRNDVSAKLGGTAYLHSGYVGAISLKNLSNGPHTITIKALVQGENAFTEMQAPVVIT